MSDLYNALFLTELIFETEEKQLQFEMTFNLSKQTWTETQKEIWKNVEAYTNLIMKGDVESFLDYFHKDSIFEDFSSNVELFSSLKILQPTFVSVVAQVRNAPDTTCGTAKLSS